MCRVQMQRFKSPKSLIYRCACGHETLFEGRNDKSGFGDFGDWHATRFLTNHDPLVMTHPLHRATFDGSIDF
jgi:hypothetical protein